MIDRYYCFFFCFVVLFSEFSPLFFFFFFFSSFAKNFSCKWQFEIKSNNTIDVE